MQILTIRDESPNGGLLRTLDLSFPTGQITVEQLIATRVRAEVERYQQDKANYSGALVAPHQLAQRINAPKALDIDVEKQIYVALDAFMKNGFFILVDDEQVETLEEQLVVADATTVSFIKLTPLVGG